MDNNEDLIMSKHRTVDVYEMKWNTKIKAYAKTYKCTGIFHQFSIGINSFESMETQTPVAIVELNDGSVMSLPVDMIKFTSPLSHDKEPIRTDPSI